MEDDINFLKQQEDDHNFLGKWKTTSVFVDDLKFFFN